MIIARVPLRISFLGGGTDYPEFFRSGGGATLVTSINRYCLVTVHRLTEFSEDRFRIHYSKIEAVRTLDEMQHPSARECLRLMGIDGGVEIHYVNDLPARTGLGSSSAATVALLLALHAFQGEMVSRDQLAAEAVKVERTMIQERVGFQDQYSCAFGGFLHLCFERDDSVRVNPVVLPPERLDALQSHMILLYTGIQRTAHEILEEQLHNTAAGQCATDLSRLKDLVSLGLDLLGSRRDVREFGDLLHEAWQHKRRLSSRITTVWIDEIYERARKAGAIGGKLLGAGGGGFLLLMVEPKRRPALVEALPELREASFAFERTGSTILFYRP